MKLKDDLINDKQYDNMHSLTNAYFVDGFKQRKWHYLKYHLYLIKETAPASSMLRSDDGSI